MDGESKTSAPKPHCIEANMKKRARKPGSDKKSWAFLTFIKGNFGMARKSRILDDIFYH